MGNKSSKSKKSQGSSGKEIVRHQSSSSPSGGGSATMQVSDDRGNSLKVSLSRRRQIVVIALDISGSMAGSRIKAAVAGVKKVLDSLSSDDMVAIATFNDSVTDFTNGFMEATDSNIRRLKSRLDNIKCTNQTAFYDAVLKCTAAVLQLSEKIKKVREVTQQLDRLGQAAGLDKDLDVDLGHAWLVVVTDGEDNKSKNSYDQCAKLLLLLAVCGIDYSVLWLGVQLSGKALKEVKMLDAVCGLKSKFCPVTSENIGSIFQEIAVKLKGSRSQTSPSSSGMRALPPSTSSSTGFHQGEIEQGSHIEVLRRVNGIGRGERGIVIEAGQDVHKVRFYVDGGSSRDVDISTSDVRLDPVADAVRPGARVRVKRGVSPKGGWGNASSSWTGLVKNVAENGAVTVDMGANTHSWMAHIGDLEPVEDPSAGHLSGRLQIGNLVRVPAHIAEPSKKWGSVKRESMGYITEFDDGTYKVNFPEADNWMCCEQDIEVVPGKDGIRPGKSVRVCVDTPKYEWGNVRPGSVGVVRMVKYDASIVHVDFPEMRDWKCPIAELELCAAVIEFD